ncbi:stomatal closure-related actin-binding protein 1-like isoform X2 [Ananas comosus]|uniref:Stomatal closure-related actin-binding protein 1-like isoform X2 n=1 Tax=Ananas comosus TaxID=4615 RepID=A0A6P5GII8_ANACO|nr:stomatal closure-related actin-binding protein 1-like isoform X2 [Ananas comosus]
MTRVARDYGDKLHNEAFRSVPLHTNFLMNRFPNYKIGTKNIAIEPNGDPEVPPLKEIVAKETADLLDRRQRLSVRELAKKFEKGLYTATLLSNEVKWGQVALLERDVLVDKLRNVLDSLRGRVVSKNRDELESSISMAEKLAVQLPQREGELLQQKAEVKKLATSLKLASEDAKRIVDEERVNARIEIESARAAVQRVQQALHEHEELSRRTEKQDVQELKTEVQAARRIKMLHYRSKVMDMENEIQVLRAQFAEKASLSVQLRKELTMRKSPKENKDRIYELEGLESLGSCLHIIRRTNTAPNVSDCLIQWYRIQPVGSKIELISGATKPVYAPEPFDVGRFLQAEITFGDDSVTVKTAGPIDPAAGLGSYVEELVRKPETEFNVVVVQENGNDCDVDPIHVLNIGRLRMKLSRGKAVVAKEFYSSSMQLCGARGGGNAAAQTLFWRPKKGLHLTLAFESVRERNAAIMLARRFAIDCNIMLAGPGDRTTG